MPEPVTVALLGYAAYLALKKRMATQPDNATPAPAEMLNWETGMYYTPPDIQPDQFQLDWETGMYYAEDAFMPQTPSSGATVIGPGNMTRGERNNNPGNIVKTSAAWEGKTASSDSRFETFTAPEFGIRALAKTLRTYIRTGRNTVAKIISTYAPPVENNTDAYIRAVEQSTGIPRDTPINADDQAAILGIATAIIRHENGRIIYTPEQIAAGVAMAFT